MDNKSRSFMLNSNVTEESLRKLELEEVSLAPKLMIFSVCNSLLFKIRFNQVCVLLKRIKIRNFMLFLLTCFEILAACFIRGH